MKKRIMVYIDGFNLYYGIKSMGWNHCFWLNIEKLITNYLPDDLDLIQIRYFTSNITNPLEKRDRQIKFLNVLQTLKSVSPHKGNYARLNDAKCDKCGAYSKYCERCGERLREYKEKKTDVNIASFMIEDAIIDMYDIAILITGDSDLRPPLEVIKRQFPKKKVLVLFPPNRDHSKDLKNFSQWHYTIDKQMLENSLFPDKVQVGPKTWIEKPAEWN